MTSREYSEASVSAAAAAAVDRLESSLRRRRQRKVGGMVCCWKGWAEDGSWGWEAAAAAAAAAAREETEEEKDAPTPAPSRDPVRLRLCRSTPSLPGQTRGTEARRHQQRSRLLLLCLSSLRHPCCGPCPSRADRRAPASARSDAVSFASCCRLSRPQSHCRQDKSIQTRNTTHRERWNSDERTNEKKTFE